MKLTRINIENFGKYSAVQFDFDQGFTEFLSDNGTGKTTLADFIRVMFYGMPVKKEGSFALRERYAPFNHGVYGGSLTFLYNGDTYRIERFFGEGARGGADKLQLFINDVLSPCDYVPGERFFKMDEASFKRTLFISDLTYDEHGTPNIKNKLNGFSVADDKTIGFDQAQKDLDALIKKYNPKQKKGDVAEYRDRINYLNGELLKCDSTAETLNELYKKHNDLSAELYDANKKRKSAAAAEVLVEKWNNYDRQIADLNEKKNSLDILLQKYPKGLPSEEKLKEINNAVDALRLLQNATIAQKPNEAESERYSYLSKIFAVGVPSAEQIAAVSNTTDNLDKLNFTANNLKQADIPYADSFKNGVPDTNVIEKCRSLLNKLRASRAEYNDALYSTAPQATTQKKKAPLILAILFAVILAVGIGVIFINLPAGIALAAFGLVGLFITGFLYLLKRGNTPNDLDSAKREAVRNAENAIKEAELEIYATLAPYGFGRNLGAEQDLERFFTAVGEYNAINTKNAEIINQANALQAEIAKSKENLSAFFALYNLNEKDNFRAALDKLKSNINEFSFLSERINRERQTYALNQEKAENALKQARQATAEFGVTPEEWANKSLLISNDILAINYLKQEIELKSKSVLSAKPDAERPKDFSVDSLDERIGALQAEITEVDHKIDVAEKIVECRADYAAEVERLTDVLNGYGYLHELYSDVRDIMAETEKRVDEKFIGPVKERFLTYFNDFSSAFKKELTINRNFDILFADTGATRPEYHLSAGESAVVSLCFRLALIDLLFDTDAPFLVLDDPFCRIDEKRLKLLRPMILKLSEKFQLVYFTCSKSRTLK